MAASEAPLYALAFSADGSHVAVAGAERAITLWPVPLLGQALIDTATAALPDRSRAE